MTNGTTIQEQDHIPHRHSGLGIASFIIALVQGVITLVVVVIAGIITAMGPQDEHEVEFMIVGLAVFGGVFSHLVGIGLGIAGVIQRNRKKIFSILGLIFNIAAVLVVSSLVIVGMMVG